MAEMILEEESQREVPSIAKFRDCVDHLKCKDKEKAFIETAYLTGSRVSELCSKVIPWELQHQRTRPYGSLLNWEFTEVKDSKGTLTKLLLLKLAVAKHRLKVENAQAENAESQNSQAAQNQNRQNVQAAVSDSTSAQTLQQTQQGQSQQAPQVPQVLKVRMRVVPVPINREMEPWAEDILRYIQRKKGRLEFPFTRRTGLEIVKRNLKELDASVHTHSLRHWRIHHLLTCYDFTPVEVSTFVGWSLRTALGRNVSSNLDLYSHLTWKDFVGKLLTPLSTIYER
jgi:hypothetical protein